MKKNKKTHKSKKTNTKVVNVVEEKEVSSTTKEESEEKEVNKEADDKSDDINEVSEKEALAASDKIKDNIKYALKYSIHTWIFKCFVIALIMDVVLEILGRRSVFAGVKFVITSPVVYVYNVSIIFFTLLFALFLRKRVFGIIMISAVWLTCGIINFLVLGYRVTPFAAIDFLMLGDLTSMIDIYLNKFQQALLFVVVGILIIILIILFKKTPKFEGSRKVKGTMIACVIAWGIVWGLTNFAMKHNFISDDFANLGTAYKDYGFAYCFTNSIVDNGIEEPEDYSYDKMMSIKTELDKIKTKEKKQTPNIIMVQLESFFDPNDVAGLNLSSNPVPNFTLYKQKYPSGYFTVPALGAGTANTEFEVLTGISSSNFGAGEYPYKTTVNHIPVEGICSILKREDYGTYAIHNNKASFYDRDNVYDEMGFDAFISLEYMYNVEYTSTGWAKDRTLVSDIIKCLNDTEGQDLVYTISVQGHGKYPDAENTHEEHIQVHYDNQEMEGEIGYYINQIYEMDVFIKELVVALNAYGEDYILVLYGDHLPTLSLSENQIENSTLFQTEYILINNIGLELEDEDIMASELSVKLLNAIGIEPGYVQKAHMLYDGEEEDYIIRLLAYDMLFGNKYMYNGKSPVNDMKRMKLGIDPISVTGVSNERNHIVVKGENFNEYSVVFMEGKKQETIYVDRNTLMVEGVSAMHGDSFTVKQVDKANNVLSSTANFIY